MKCDIQSLQTYYKFYIVFYCVYGLNSSRIHEWLVTAEKICLVSTVRRMDEIQVCFIHLCRKVVSCRLCWYEAQWMSESLIKFYSSPYANRPCETVYTGHVLRAGTGNCKANYDNVYVSWIIPHGKVRYAAQCYCIALEHTRLFLDLPSHLCEGCIHKNLKFSTQLNTIIFLRLQIPTFL
jgi:hypothetical protein